MNEVLKQLQSLEIDYQIIYHQPVYTIDDIKKVDDLNMEMIVKNLFVRDDKKQNYYLVVVRHDRLVNLKQLRTLINSRRLSFASIEDLDHYLGLKPGSVSPLGILNDQMRKVIVVMDSDIKKLKTVGIHPNDNRATLLISYDDLIKVLKTHGNQIIDVDL